jgi:hypothetical protein
METPLTTVLARHAAAEHLNNRKSTPFRMMLLPMETQRRQLIISTGHLPSI